MAEKGLGYLATAIGAAITQWVWRRARADKESPGQLQDATQDVTLLSAILDLRKEFSDLRQDVEALRREYREHVTITVPEMGRRLMRGHEELRDQIAEATAQASEEHRVLSVKVNALTAKVGMIEKRLTGG